MFITLINRQTRKPNDVNVDHIVSIWEATDSVGVWDVTRCRDVNGVEYEKAYFYKKSVQKILNNF